MKIAIGSDHAGVDYKEKIKILLVGKGYEVKDFGTLSHEKVDYPDFIHLTADAVERGCVKLGIILCGSGNGAAMTANKHQKIRAALAWDKEQALLARQHNDANIISIPARFVSEETALEMVETFLNTKFEGGRHQIRVEKISIKS
ncbi:MAG: ribose 5-phosphate isomerase B [Flavobacteriales bacterium AspAUS03]